VANLFTFVDEIEVYRGRDEMLSQPYQGSPVTAADMNDFVNSQIQTKSLNIQRIVYDAQEIQQQVAAAAGLTTAQKAQYTSELADYIVQAMYDSLTANVVLPIDNLHANVFKVQAELWRAQGLADLVAWSTDSQWDDLAPTSAPIANSAGVSVTMMQNEFRSDAFSVSNTTNTDLVVYVRITGLPGGTNPSYIGVQEAAWTSDISVAGIASALVDATNTDNGYLIHVPAGMTRQVWLTFHPTATAAGEYAGTIVVDGGIAGMVNVPVDFQLSALQFPTTTALDVGGYDYTNTAFGDVKDSNKALLIAKMREHLVNAPWGTAAVMPLVQNPTDFSAFDAWLELWPAATTDTYHVMLQVGTTFGGLQMGTTEFNAAVQGWINAYVAYWTGKGIAPNRIVLELVDEPQTHAQATIIVNWATAIHQAQPNVLIFENPVFPDPAGADNADCSAVCNVSNILLLNRQLFLTGSESDRQFYEQQRDSGKTLNFYSCMGPVGQLDPYAYYRLQAWTCFAEDATSMFYWGFADQGGTYSWKLGYAWQFPYAPLLLEPNAVTDSKAIEAIREGMEDFQYLTMLKDRIAEMTTGNGPPAVIAAAQSVLDTAVATVLDDPNVGGYVGLYWTSEKDRTVADTMRIQVLEMLETLANYPSFSVQPTNQAADVGQTATFIAAVAGATPMTYQWQRYSSGTWQNVSGATGAYYTTPAAVQGDDGKLYRVVAANSYGSLTSSTAALFVNYGLEAWWKLDEASGASASDVSGKAHTGTLTNGPTWTFAGGILNGTVTLDGLNDYVSVPATSTLKYTTGQLTLSTWVWIDSAEATGGWLISKNWDSTHANYWLSLGADNKISFGVGNASESTSITTTSALATGVWHHLAATVDTGKTMRLYVDGTQVASSSHSISTWPSGNGLALLLGKKTTGSSSDQAGSFCGRLDNSRIYTHALSAEAIAEQSRCPVAYWKLDATSGTTAADASGNGNTGTLVNGSTWTTAGYINGGLQFDGTNDFVSVPSTTALKYTGGELTLGAWIRLDAEETTGGWLLSKAWNNSGQYNFWLRLGADNKVSFALQPELPGATEITTSTALLTGRWYHIAATVDTAKVMTLYIDGAAVASGVHSITSWAATDSNMALTLGTINANAVGSSYCIDGIMDNVRIFNQALNAAEVTTLVLDPPVAPTIESIVINDGNAQRSRLKSLTVTFNAIVAIDAGAFEVLKNGIGGGLVDILVTAMIVNNRTVATLTFSGSFTEGNSLKDGEYQLTVRGDRIRDSAASVWLDGDGDGFSGGNRVFGALAADKFFRKFGDSDGDRDVDSLDLFRFRQASANAYRWYFDFDDDGDSDSADLLQFRRRYA
jgi:hypothetical protein